jgi:hypothetical protein
LFFFFLLFVVAFLFLEATIEMGTHTQTYRQEKPAYTTHPTHGFSWVHLLGFASS